MVIHLRQLWNLEKKKNTDYLQAYFLICKIGRITDYVVVVKIKVRVMAH